MVRELESEVVMTPFTLEDWAGDRLEIEEVDGMISIDVNDEENIQLMREHVLDVINVLADWLEGEFTE